MDNLILGDTYYKGLQYHYEDALAEVGKETNSASPVPPLAKFARRYYQSIVNLNPTGEKIYDFCFIGSTIINKAERQWVMEFAKEHFTADSVFINTDQGHQSLGPFDKTNDPMFKGWYNPRRNYDNQSRNVQYRVVSENEMYFRTMSQSKYILCPAGDGPWSFRFYETLLCGSIPVVKSWHHTYRSAEESKIGFKHFLITDDMLSVDLQDYKDLVSVNTELFKEYHLINY